MTIKRFSGGNRGRCRAVVYGGLVYAVATDTSSAGNIADQTRRTLEALERSLVDAGSGRGGLLQVTVYLKDMAMKAQMDAVWCDWIGAAQGPCRACVGTDLAPGDRVEIKLLAVKRS